MGAFITDTNPEDVAEQLRAVVVGVSDEVDRSAHAGSPSGSAPTPEGVWAAPGRVNVIGEHTDYNGGFVLPVAMEHTTRAAVARRDDGRVALASLQGDGAIVELGVDELAPGSPRRLGRLSRRASSSGLRDRLPGGVSILVDTDVPVGAGPVLVGRADLLGRAGAARPRRPRAAPAGPRRAGPRARRTTSSARRPASSTSPPRCSARPGTRCSSTPATAPASRCRSTWRPPGWRCSSSTPASRTTTPRAATATAGGSARQAAERLGVAAAARGRRRRAPCERPGRRQRRGRRPAAPGAAHRHRERPGARGGRRAARGRRPAGDRADPHRRARVAARRLRDLGPAARRHAWRRRSRPARTAPAWSAAASAAARSPWSTPTRSTG